MPQQFRIKETIDSRGHRVIVYEFLGTRGARKRKSRWSDSFIKVTFESTDAARRAAAGRQASEETLVPAKDVGTTNHSS